MLKCISYWSFEGGLEQKKPLEEAFNETKEAGFNGIELTMGETGILNINSTKEECEEIASKANKVKIAHKTTASGIPWQYSLTDNKLDIRGKGIEYVKKMLNMTNNLYTLTY